MRIDPVRTLPSVRTTADSHERFAAMFDELSPRVYGYARRHCDATGAQDVVADTFLVAWRRWSEVPTPALPWLLVVARNTIANRRRGELRQHRLVDAVGRLEVIAGPAASADQDVLEREAVCAALAELSDAEREAILLVAWDGLNGREAAQVAGCSARAFEVRLSRARKRLSRSLGSVPRRGVHDSDGILERNR